MPRQPIELAREHYERLPAVLKQALFSTEIAEQMFEIGKKFGLTIEKTGIMAEETGYVMLGLARPGEFVANLASELSVETDKAQDVAGEINHRIFFPLREELKRTHNFDMDAGEIAGSGALRIPGPPERLTSSSRAGMPMPPSIQKTFAEEKSPLVSDLTRVREETPKSPTSPAVPASKLPPKPAPSFQPPTEPTGRIADLQKMVAKPPLPVAKPMENKLLITQPKEVPEIPDSFAQNSTSQSHPERSEGSPAGKGATTGSRSFGLRPQDDTRGTDTKPSPEPWEKDIKQEVSSLLTQNPVQPIAPVRPSVPGGQPPESKGPLPIDLRPQQKTVAPPILVPQTRLPPIDLRQPLTSQALQSPTPPRTTPQLQNLSGNQPLDGQTGPTLLQEKMRTEPQKPVTSKSAPGTVQKPPLTNAEDSVGIAIPASIRTDGDPYREPIDQTDI
ncbi:MAG: hypothetical protein HY007_02255 [Candidatus Sungbacteria bacterium]|nr:hypothetical protein [Candidatus Sungbacteria bacterium]